MIVFVATSFTVANLLEKFIPFMSVFWFVPFCAFQVVGMLSCIYIRELILEFRGYPPFFQPASTNIDWHFYFFKLGNFRIVVKVTCTVMFCLRD